MRTLIAIFVLLVQSLAFASTLTCSYDSAGRLVNVNYGGNTNATFSFDNNGNLLSQSTFVSANADLAISQSASPAPVLVGKPLQFTVTVFNNSSAAASPIKLTNTLPANATYLSNSVSQGSVTHASNKLNWSVGKLTNAAAATMTFTVLPLTIGPLTNTASVAYASSDPFTADNLSVFVTGVVAPPEAVAGSAEGRFSISWPIAGGENFTVQYSDSLTPPVIWTPFPIDPAIDGELFFVEDSVTNAHRFYRLVAP